MDDVCRELPEQLRKENGSGFGFVWIDRPAEQRSKDSDGARRCTVEEFLSRPENQSGRWLIDGGWGGPPGPICVEWQGDRWINLGFPPWDGPYKLRRFTDNPFVIEVRPRGRPS